MSRHWCESGRPGRSLVAAAVLAALALGSSLGSTSAAFTGVATASTQAATRGACALGTPYSSLLSTPALRPTLWWRFANTTGTTTVADASGNANTGAVLGTGLTFGTANAGLVSCDTTYAMRQAGAAASTGFVVATTPRTSPTDFTIATWVLSSSLTGGRLVGFGDSAIGGSTLQDRALLFDRSGRVVFHLRTTSGNTLLTSPSRVTNNSLHLVVATVTGGRPALYVDGALVASTLPLVLAPSYTGYWRAGWDQNVATLIPTARNQAATRQDEVAVWEGRALSAAEVTALFSGNHW